MPEPLTSRDSILDAAERLFARQGFAATTIKDIGTAAGVNSALLYYYFTDKATLYEAVLRRLLYRLAARAGAGLDASETPEDAIRAFVAAQVELLQGNPNIPRLLVRELIDHDAEHAQPFIIESIATVFRQLCDAIRRGQRAGRFRRQVRPEFAAISVISQVVYLFIARPAAAILLGHQDRVLPDRTAADFARHAGDFAVAALAAHPVKRQARVSRSSTPRAKRR
ncbi:MAG TPA: TetR family transcriptional regulator [Gemmatimonadaceae bacterium]|jgi:TetR/AcrR family transcriptional regulator|nr:TetR family transcriptional regulator [Gemmatimonadaceae bacterium]